MSIFDLICVRGLDWIGSDWISWISWICGFVSSHFISCKSVREKRFSSFQYEWVLGFRLTKHTIASHSRAERSVVDKNR